MYRVLARQYDLREPGLDGPLSSRSTLELTQVLEKQFHLDNERCAEKRLRAYGHLYGNTRYPLGHVKRGGILNTYSAEEAKTQIIWWAEKGEMIIEDVLLFSHLFWSDSRELYAAIFLRYRAMPSRIRAHNVVVTEVMEEEHKHRHPQLKSRNLPKVPDWWSGSSRSWNDTPTPSCQCTYAIIGPHRWFA